MVAVATKGSAPYKSVVTNGWTLDDQGRAMHKSLGNVVDPLKIMQQVGADVLRWWVASTNFMEDQACGDAILKQVAEIYRRIRNTFRFLVNNLYDFDAERDAVPLEEMLELDRWVLAQLARVSQTCVAAFDVHEFNKVYNAVHNFCAVELSAFYLDVIKDRLYTSKANSLERRSAQTALLILAETLARLVAPILVHTADEAWGYLNLPNKVESVHLADYPTGEGADEALTARWEPLFLVRETVKKALEEARQAGTIGNPLEACVEIEAEASVLESLAPFSKELATLCVVSQAILRRSDEEGVSVTARPADGVKCARCWLMRLDVGQSEEHPALCTRCVEALA
jgi:isoleucyl-tRNA synthetase